LEDGGSRDIAQDAVVLRISYTQKIKSISSTLIEGVQDLAWSHFSSMQLDSSHCKLTVVSLKTAYKLNPAQDLQSGFQRPLYLSCKGL
jgi:hypothetical protein